MLVDLGDGIALNPDHAVSVRHDFYGRYLIVTDVLGNVHEVQRRYGESIWDAEKRVVAALSAGNNPKL